MEVIYGPRASKPRTQKTVLTIGNFDGMHFGHRAILTKVKEEGEKLKISGGLLTFEPHPLKVLFPERNFHSLFDLQDRIDIAAQIGLDFFAIEPFSRELSELSAEEFFTSLLLDKLKVQSLFVGHDFSFGKDREGTLTVLESLCRKYAVQLEVIPPFKIEGEVVSSTKIREAVRAGFMEKATKFLGRPFHIKGVVEKGAGRGRKIGFPTANLFTPSELIPKPGVYITGAQLKGRGLRSVTNVGFNPTFLENNKRILVETHILNFDEDIYGEPMEVEFLHYLRTEKKFGSVMELVEQIKKDVERTREYVWPQKT